MNKGLQAFDDFMAGILAKITDPDQRRKAEEGVATLKQVAPVVQALGDGVAGQSEIDRQLQTLTAQRDDLTTRQADIDDREARMQTWHTELSNWYADQKAALARAKAHPPTGDPAADPAAKPSGFTEDTFTERIGTERAAFLGFSRDQNQITREHFTKFGEIVDLEPLLKHPSIGQVGLLGVYELVHKARLTDWTTKQATAAEDTIRADERQKIQAQMASMPYPTPTGAGSGSPLDALTVGKKDGVVDEAAAHYSRLVAERAGAAAR